LLEGMDAEVAGLSRKAPRVPGPCPVLPAPLGDPQAADLGQREIDAVVAAVGPGTAREARGDVGHRVEVEGVEDDELAVLRGDDGLLEEIRAEAVGQGLGRQGVLREVAAGAPVRDHHGCRAHGRPATRPPRRAASASAGWWWCTGGGPSSPAPAAPWPRRPP